jgi:peptidoglycan/xylan/chitin deacetylase (PgdA/CDA1 family)
MLPRAIFTIDDAPTSTTQLILDVLLEHQVKAIFFCLGANMVLYPEVVQQILHAGHTLGNHAYSHKPFSQMRLSEGINEIEHTESLINEAYTQAGISQRNHLFRFPYGDKGFGTHPRRMMIGQFSPKVRGLQRCLQRLQFQSPHDLGIQMPRVRSTDSPFFREFDWYWSGDSRDWLFTKQGRNPDTFGNWVREQIVPKATTAECEVLLFHDHSGHGRLIQQAFPVLTERFRFVIMG